MQSQFPQYEVTNINGVYGTQEAEADPYNPYNAYYALPYVKTKRKTSLWSTSTALVRMILRKRGRAHRLLALYVVCSLLLSPFTSSSPVASAPSSSAPSTTTSAPAPNKIPVTAPNDPSETSTSTSTSSPTFLPTSQTTAITTGTTTATGTATGTETASITPSETPTENTPPPTYTIAIPTAPPTLSPIPDTDYEDQALDRARDSLLAQVAALPALTGTITGTIVSGLTGGRITSPDSSLTLGMRPEVVAVTQTIDVRVNRMTFQPGDPRATHDGQPLAYTYELTATDHSSGEPVTQFNNEVTLVWNLDPAALEAAGVKGFPLHVYTYNEEGGYWYEIPSMWKGETNQLIARTPHFSLYSIGDGWNKVNNFLPNVKDFEVDLQTGTSSVSYPINLPTGPGGFGPKVTLTYNSGNVSRVDNTQQGPSSVGWGWNLSTNYVAATQHDFTTTDPGYYPWTASMVDDGINGDLVKGTDGYWHTANESFARIAYITSTTGTPPKDQWEAWDKGGTHYIFDQKVVTENPHSSPTPGTSPYRWMLGTATDVHSNTITYSYAYEITGTSRSLVYSPVTDTVGAVYPYRITYGAGGDKIQVTFHVVDRHITPPGSPTATPTIDISSNDKNNGDNSIYQSYRIDRIDVERLQAGSTGTTTPTTTPTYALLRSYEFSQTYTINLTTTNSTTPYPHLTLNSIIAKGNSDKQLPNLTFTYILTDTCTYAGNTEFDHGHLCIAKNGYGGEVDFYYDAAGSTATNKAIRRIRAKRVKDGLEDPMHTPAAGESTPHNAFYQYDYHGAILNDKNNSGDTDTTYPLHSAGSEFRGFGFVQVRDPMKQATNHYFSQDDAAKGTEWRTQEGITETLVETMTTFTPTPGAWTYSGGVVGAQDPTTTTTNGVWKIPPGQAITRTDYLYLGNGADVSVRFDANGSAQTTPFSATWKLENTAGSNGEYWGLQVYVDANKDLQPKVVWKTSSGAVGSRDLAPASTLYPHRGSALTPNDWYRLHLHTSPDGRFALELYDDGENTNGANYLQIKSGDHATTLSDTIPSLPVGGKWVFEHEVDASTNTAFQPVIDDYHEARTIYSQEDSVYSDQTVIQATAMVAQESLGQVNNCNGMKIRFVPKTESWTTTFGTGDQLWTTKRSKEVHYYQGSYGNQTKLDEFADVDVPGLERSTLSVYGTVSNTNRYIVDKPAETKIYSGTYGTSGALLMGWTRQYYDGRSIWSGGLLSTSKGELTRNQQIGVSAAGASNGQFSNQDFEYDSYGNKTRQLDPNSNSTNTEYDEFYRSFPITVTSANTAKEITKYNYRLDTVSETVDMNGLTTEFQSDEFGRPNKMWVAGSDTELTPTMRYSFPDIDASIITAPFYISIEQRLQSNTAQTNWQTRWFDGQGRVLKEISPKDSTNSTEVDTTYTNTGVISSTTMPYLVPNTGPSGTATPVAGTIILTTTHYYDGKGRPSMLVSPDNSHTIYDYGVLQWIGTADEVSNYKWQRTDLLGRMDQTKDEDRTSAPTPTSVVNSYKYDSMDRLVQITRDQGTGSQYKNITSTISYDGLGRKSQMIDPDMGTWKYLYDQAGNLTVQTDTLYLSTVTSTNVYSDHEIFFQYDNMNRLTKKYYGATHYGDGSTGTPDVVYYYDNDLSDATTTYSWNKLRRVNLIGYGSTEDQKDSNGHGYVYDSRGHTVADVITTGYRTYTDGTYRFYTTTQQYDTADRLTSLVYPNWAPSATPTPEEVTEAVTVTYNGQGVGLPERLASSYTSGSRHPYPVEKATYNERGQLLTLGQGTLNSYDYITTTYGYDEASTKRGWLANTTVTATDFNPNPHTTVTYLNLGMQYTLNGNISQIANSVPSPNATANPNFTNSYSYDGLDRLRVASSTSSEVTQLFDEERYGFDSLSRMITRTIGTGGSSNYTYSYTDTAHIDAPTGYSNSADSRLYGYDANGNQITTTNPLTNRAQTRWFDAENRLVVLTNTTISNHNYTLSKYVYDGNGQRLAQKIDGYHSDGTEDTDVVRTHTLYIGNLYEEDLTTPVLTHGYICYYYLGGSSGKLVGLRRKNMPGADGQYRIVGDHLGSTTLVIDTPQNTNTVPAVVDRKYYKPYGELAWEYTTWDGSRPTDKGFTGQRLDKESQLMYYGARYYDPVLSYFISPDSVAAGVAGDSSSSVALIDQQQESRRINMLTVAFNEPQFLASLSQENAGIGDEITGLQSEDDSKQWKPPTSQALNRYTYVFNNPVRYTDPTGHIIPLLVAFAVGVVASVAIDVAIDFVANNDHFDLKTSVGNSLKDPLTYISAIPFGEVTKLGKLGKFAGVAEKVGCSFNSFSADTDVTTIKGQVPIGKIGIGDLVLAYDEATGKEGYYPVTALIVNDDKVIELVSIDGEEIQTTPEHPFYTLEETWVLAGKLWPGAHVREADGQYGTVQLVQRVQTVELAQHPQTMYNLTVDGAHTFFVGDGRWLVHNSCAKYNKLLAEAQAKYPKLAGKTQLHHITPKYLGGDPKGPLVALDAAYHRQITNAFQGLWRYGQGRLPTPANLRGIMRQVYRRYPLP